MQIYQERRKVHRLLYSRLVLTALLIVVLILLVASLRVSFDAYRASRAREEAEREAERLLAQKERIDERIKDLENPETLAKEVKKRFNITDPGEKVLIIVERKKENMAARPPQRKVWEFIKNVFR